MEIGHVMDVHCCQQHVSFPTNVPMVVVVVVVVVVLLMVVVSDSLVSPSRLLMWRVF